MPATAICARCLGGHLDRPAEADAHVPLASLTGRTDGLLALTGGGEGALARLLAQGQREAAEQLLDTLETLFPGRLYVELSRRGDATEMAAEAQLIELADARNLPLVATNPALYADADFHRAHDAMLCIAQSSQIDRDDRTRSSPEAWIKPADAMRAAFADLPDAIANTSVVARRCAFAAPKRKPILPSLAGDQQAEAEQLRRDARQGLIERLRHYPLPADANVEQAFSDYFARLDFECDVIIRMGFPGYFLIVADFIKWAKEQGIPVGRAAAPAPARWSPGRSPSPISIRSARPAVRALPQSRARVDAGLSTSIFAKPARRRHPLRPAALRHGQGRADHHLRKAEGARGPEGHRAGVCRCLWAGGPARQARAEPPDRAVGPQTRSQRHLGTR
jgi:hypothetical protein